MTVREARRLLRGPLRFGDEDQIRAIAFLKRIEKLKLQMRELGLSPREIVGVLNDPNYTLSQIEEAFGE